MAINNIVESNYRPNELWQNLHPEQWNELVDSLDYTDLLPHHFLKSTFPKIGGQLIIHRAGAAQFCGEFMPGPDIEGREWTMRMHYKNGDHTFKQQMEHDLTLTLFDLGYGNGIFYNVEEKSQSGYFGEKQRTVGDYEYATPSRDQAQHAQELQKNIWGVNDPRYLYPADLYRKDAGTATRLTVLHDRNVVGFLLGFYGNDGQNRLWIESQLMGVDEDYRGKGIGKQLKLLQRDLALQERIGTIEWTFDPLQAGNAYLNLNVLGGMVTKFYENYYPFQNDQNRVSPSRLKVTWDLSSDRVIGSISGTRHQPGFYELARRSDAEVVIPPQLQAERWNPKGNVLLIQIPTNWTDMQRNHNDKALAWRQAGDKVFNKIIGTSEDTYAITGIVRHSEFGSEFLIAEKNTDWND